MMVSNINVYNVYTCILCFLVSGLYCICIHYTRVSGVAKWKPQVGRRESGGDSLLRWRVYSAVERSGECTGLTYQHVTPGRTAEGQERTLGQLQHLMTSPGYFSILWERERPSLVDQVCSFAEFQCPDDIRWSGLQASNL